MGSQESKMAPETDNPKDPVQTPISAPSTPILTPLDPRSPSVNIARTPLEQLLLRQEKSEELQDCDETIDTSKWDEGSETVNVILGIDPRSPTVEFTRTPIIVAAAATSKKLENKNLTNVLKSVIQTPPTARTRRSGSIPPRLIGSTVISPLSPSIINNKKLGGFLETNLDYTETNLDDICQNNDNNTSICQNKEDNNASLPIVLNEASPISNKLKKQTEVLNDITQFDNTECQVEKTINITEQVKDFDKKLTNLIYEDEVDDEKILKIGRIQLKAKDRTPLATRNGNEEPKKNLIRLKVHDKPRRQEGSKIPVFKDIQRKGGIQCENTPPRSMGETRIKTKVSRWDADKTVII